MLSFLTPAANAVYPQRIWLFVLGLAPFLFCWFCVCLLSDETQIWLGDLRVVGCLRLFFLVCFYPLCGWLQVHGHSALYSSSFYHFYFLQDRASGNIGRTRGKKKEAKLPSSQTSFTCLHSIGYLTATTEWYVTGLTRELEGITSPHACRFATPAVSEFSVACRSFAIGSVAACWSIQARRTKDRGKLTTVPSSRCGATVVGYWALSCWLAG